MKNKIINFIKNNKFIKKLIILNSIFLIFGILTSLFKFIIYLMKVNFDKYDLIFKIGNISYLIGSIILLFIILCYFFKDYIIRFKKYVLKQKSKSASVYNVTTKLVKLSLFLITFILLCYFYDKQALKNLLFYITLISLSSYIIYIVVKVILVFIHIKK